MVREKPRPKCSVEGCSKQSAKNYRKKGVWRWKKYCRAHANEAYGNGGKLSYRRYKKDHCSKCDFLPLHPGQLDVDHIDGNHDNDSEDNLQTLCANCHRLKTHCPELFDSYKT